MDDKNPNSFNHALNEKLMIVSVIIVFLACFITILFHSLARFRRNRQLNYHDHRRSLSNWTAAVLSRQGLDLRAMNSIPIFTYESKNYESPLECAVCLSDFEDNESGRVLPQCNHCFHVDCIDMWFQCHCDCPLCRAQVKGMANKSPIRNLDPHQRIVEIRDSENTGNGSNHDLDSTFHNDGNQMGSGLTGTIGQDPIRSADVPNSDMDVDQSDIESGPKPTAGWIRVLKRLFGI